MKSYYLNGMKVVVCEELALKQPYANGKPVPPQPIVDNEGRWVQVEFEDGPNKGNRVPTTKEKLTEK